jgi:hypothetical protein
MEHFPFLVSFLFLLARCKTSVCFTPSNIDKEQEPLFAPKQKTDRAVSELQNNSSPLVGKLGV